MLTTALSPARAFMDRLSFAWKFVAIAVVLLAPLGYVAYSYLGVQRTNTEFSAKERVGTEYIIPATDVVADIARVRSAAVLAAADAPGSDVGLDAAVKALDTSMEQLRSEDAADGTELETTKLLGTLADQVDAAAAKDFATPSEAYTAWNEISASSLGLVLQAGNISNLILDPDLDTYYLMDSHVVRLVTLLDLTGQAADLQRVIELEHLSGTPLVERRLELSRVLGSIDFNNDTLAGNYATSLDSTDQADGWRKRIDGDLAAYTSSFAALRTNVDSAVHGSIEGADASKLAADTQTKLVDLQGSTSKELDDLIVDRLSGFAAAKRTTLVVSGVALALAAFLFLGFYGSVRAALRNLLGASEAIGRGELGNRVNVTSRDEIGRMAQSFQRMAESLRDTADAAKQIAEGDVQVDVALRSEQDELGNAFRDMVSYLQETATIAESLSNGDVTVEPKVRSERDALGKALHETVHYLREMSQTAGVDFSDLGTHIAEQAAVAERIADGDLSLDVQPKSEGDVLGIAFQRMTGNLREVMGDLSENAAAVSAASEQLAATSRDVTSDMEAATAQIGELETGSTEQLRILEQVRGRTESATGATGRVVERSTGGREAMRAASDAMDELERSAGDVTDTMRSLEGHGKRIDDIITTITAISEQTNLLALNAAIEAARAGDAGRGFAVVADEVRKLAEESQSAAASVAEIVHSMQGETERAVSVIERTARQATDGATLVQRASDAFEEIDTAVRDAGERVDEISRDAVDASHVAERAGLATREVGLATSQTTASMQEVAASSGELAQLAEQLTSTTSRFTLAGYGTSTASLSATTTGGEPPANLPPTRISRGRAA